VGPSLAVVIPAAFLARALSVSVNLGYVARTENFGRLLIFDRSRFRELIGFGAWVSITSVVSPLLTSIDQLLVGSVLGATAVAQYAVPMNLVGRSQIVATALARTLFPRFSRLGQGEASLLAQKAVVTLSYTFGTICGLAIVAGGPFISLWIGPDFASHATPVLELLLVGAWINGIAFLPYSFLEGQGRPDLVAKLHLLEFAPFIAILWFLLHRFGLPGAALAWTGRVAVDAALLFAAARFSFHYLLRLIPALVLILLCYVITQTVSMSLLWSGVLAGLILMAFPGLAIVFDDTSREMFFALRKRLAQTI
jgi:O-antigen/teichoic acid export membrane protein